MKSDTIGGLSVREWCDAMIDRPDHQADETTEAAIVIRRMAQALLAAHQHTDVWSVAEFQDVEGQNWFDVRDRLTASFKTGGRHESGRSPAGAS